MTLPPDDIVMPGELDGPSSQEKDILVRFGIVQLLLNPFCSRHFFPF